MGQLRARFGALVVGDAVVLAGCRPSPHLAGSLAAPHDWIARVGADAATVEVAGALLWCAALWLGVGLACGLATALPGISGRAARRCARVVLPRAIYRLAAGATGLGLLLTPVAAGAAPTAGTPTAGPPTGASSTARTSSPSGSISAATPSATPFWPSDSPLPAPAWPTTTVPGARRPTTSAPARPRATPIPSTARPASDAVVRPGDSLWTIAADHLGPRATTHRIASTWPRWFAANRAVIGDDPDHLVPGQLLHGPTERTLP